MADKNKKQEYVPALDDSPSDEYATLDQLMVEARIRQWADKKIGRMLKRHFGHLLEVAESSQYSACDVCDGKIQDSENVAMLQGKIVHRHCREFPNNTCKQIERALKAYREQRLS